jgi:hypothetical protein
MQALTTERYIPETVPPFTVHLKRQREDGEPQERALCGSRWGGFAVAEPGARLPHILPVEFICDRCAEAHLAGSV